MSIFGTTHPKIKTQGGTEIELENAFDFKWEVFPKIAEHKKYETYGREYDGQGAHLTYSSYFNIFGWNDEETKYKDIIALQGQSVYLALFSDGSYLENSSGTDVLFFIKTLKHKYLEDSSMSDVLYLKLYSLDFVDLSRAN